MFKRLRNRFLFMHMGIVLLLIGLFFGSVLLINYNNMEKTANNRLEQLWPSTTYVTTAVAVTTEGRNAFFGGSTTVTVRPAGLFVPGIFITVDPQQNIIAKDSVYDMEDRFYEALVKNAFVKKAPVGKVQVGNIAMQYKRQDNQILFIDVTGETDAFKGMVRSFIMIALPLAVMIFMLSLFFANRAIAPIEGSYNRQREFIADASHELKTPLAAILTNLEVLKVKSSDEPDDQKWLGYIQSEVGRMSDLTNSLLYLAKLDQDAGFIVTSLDLSKLVEDILLPLEAVMFEKRIKTEITIEPDIHVMGEAEQLRRLIGILTDNALRYNAGYIAVQLEQAQNYAVLTVTNDGAGIPASDLPRIWERFYRCDRSRQYDGGYGLGLPMAKSIAERHKGRIGVESMEDGLTTFTVRIPV